MFRSSAAMAMRVAVATMGLVLHLLLTCTGHGEAGHARFTCPGSDTSTPIYSYWSLCSNPVESGSTYHISTLSSTGLAPEWDETNSTWYVRVSDSPATYRIYDINSTISSYVAQQDAVALYNIETELMLSWRQEGGEYFLIESSSASSFQFVATVAALPCPQVLNAMCEAYYLLDYSASTGLSDYKEDGVTYFQQSSDSLHTFILTKPSSAAISSGLPHIVSVV